MSSVIKVYYILLVKTAGRSGNGTHLKKVHRSEIREVKINPYNQIRHWQQHCSDPLKKTMREKKGNEKSVKRNRPYEVK